jgi:hypothetical protein
MSPGIREDRNMIKRRINICYQNLIVLFVANFVILIFVFVFCIYILRERPFNLKGGGYGFLFRSEFFFRTTQELEKKFPEFNIRLYDKNSNQIFFFFL